MDIYSELNNKQPFRGLRVFPPGFRLERFSRAWTRFILLFSDFFSIGVSAWLALGVLKLMNLKWESSSILLIGPLWLAFGGLYTLVGLYRSRGVNQVEELRQLIITTTMIFLSLFTFNTWMGDPRFPAVFFAFCWTIAIILIPLSRTIVRRLGASIGIWGEPVVIIGNGKLGCKIIRYLQKNPGCGMRPVMVIDGSTQNTTDKIEKDSTIPIIPFDEWPASSASELRFGISTAIVATPDLPASISDLIAHGEHLGFSNIITVSEQFNTRNVGLVPLDFGGVLGLEERHYLLNSLEDRQIRIFDLFLIISSLPILIPLILLIMIAIKLDSKGSVFYRQTRIGKGARKFEVIKFRTMVENADEVLGKFLDENPEMRAEWNADHKLKDDPRITNIGKLLRKTSLDELPQLWNVVKGEMGLVGPRPIVKEEIKCYENRFKYYVQVPPGITGLWQVSGRNDIRYKHRVSLDEYYVRNRSIWMNLHILVRTVSAVIRRQGAY
jgi:Undecaprenyl-phosphate galactose phosphotransferase WbaP